MTETPPEHWTVIEVDPEDTDALPDSVDSDDGPFAWKNENTGRGICIEPNDELEDFEAWLIRGENSVVDSAATLGEAQDTAHDFMEEYAHPSAMI